MPNDYYFTLRNTKYFLYVGPPKESIFFDHHLWSILIEIIVNLELPYRQKIRDKILAQLKSIVGSSTATSLTALIINTIFFSKLMV